MEGAPIWSQEVIEQALFLTLTWFVNFLQSLTHSEPQDLYFYIVELLRIPALQGCGEQKDVHFQMYAIDS